MPDNNGPINTNTAIDQDLPKVMEGLDQTSPTDAQADQYGQTANDIDADRPNPVPSGPPGVPPSPNGATPVPGQPQNQNQPPAQKVVKNTPNTAPNQPTQPVNPVTQKAGWVHDIAQTLAGGPRYDYKVNPNTGEMEKVAVPVSGKHLGLAIALEAISGGLTGLAQGKGAGNMGKGGAAAFQQAQQQRQMQDQLKRKQASDDYARQASIAQTNMNMLRNEQISAQADEAFQQQDVDNNADEFKELNDGGYIRQTGLTSDKVQQLLNDKTLNVTQDMIIPYKVIPQIGPDGKPVLTSHGAPKFEKLWALTDPAARITPDPDLQQRAFEAHLPGWAKFVDGKWVKPDLPPDIKMRAHQVIGLQEQLRPYQQTDQSIDNLDKGYDHVLHSGTTAPTPGAIPEIKDSNLSDISDKAADSHDLDKGLFRAVALQESGGNPKVQDSKPNTKGVYAVGPFQVTPQTAALFKNPETGKPYTEREIRDPQTNANVAATYLSNLVKANDGDIHKALVQYHGAGAEKATGMTGEKYANQVLSKYNPTENTTGGLAVPKIEAPETPLRSNEAIDKGLIIPDDMKTLQKLHGAPTLFDGQWSTKDVINASEKDKTIDPASVGRLMNWLGPTIDYRYQQNQDRQARIKAGYGVEKSGEIADNKTKEDQKAQDKIAALLAIPEGYKYNYADKPLEMSPSDLQQYLNAKGVQTPPDLSALQGVAKLQLSPDQAAQKLYAHQIKMDRQEVMSYVKNFLNPGYDDSQWEEKKRFASSLGNTAIGQAGGQVQSIDRASQHLEVLDEAANKLQNGDFTSINELKNWAAKQLGYSAPDVFDTVAQVVQTEVAKISGGGAPALTEIEDLKKRLNSAKSPQQIKDVVNAEISLMSGAYNSINQRVNNFYKYDKGGVADVLQGAGIKPTERTARLYGMRGLDVPGYGTPINDKTTGKPIGLAVKDPDTGKMIPTMWFWPQPQAVK